jgi:hypothetical protein
VPRARPGRDAVSALLSDLTVSPSPTDYVATSSRGEVLMRCLRLASVVAVLLLASVAAVGCAGSPSTKTLAESTSTSTFRGGPSLSTTTSATSGTDGPRTIAPHPTPDGQTRMQREPTATSGDGGQPPLPTISSHLGPNHQEPPPTQLPLSPTPSATLTEITVTGSGQSLSVGASGQLTATGSYSNFSTENLTDSVLWNSGDRAVATVSPHGTVTATGSGNTRITATYNNNLHGSTMVTVTDSGSS